MMDQGWIATRVTARAGAAQLLAGLGWTLVSLALLPPLLGLRAAAPLVALMPGTIGPGSLVCYREALHLAAVRIPAVALIVGIRVGLLGLG